MLVIPHDFIFHTSIKIGINIYITDIIMVIILILTPIKYTFSKAKVSFLLLILLVVRVLLSLPYQDIILVFREVRPLFSIILVGVFIYVLEKKNFFKDFDKYNKLLIIIYIVVSLIFIHTWYNPYFRLGGSPWIPELFRFEARGYPYTTILFLLSFSMVAFKNNKTILNFLFLIGSYFIVFLNGSRMLFLVSVILTMIYIYKHFSKKIKLMIATISVYIIPIVITSLSYLIYDNRNSTGRRFDEYNMVFGYMENIKNLLYGLDFGFLYKAFYKADANVVESVTFIHNSYLMMLSKGGLLLSMVFLGIVFYLFFKYFYKWIKIKKTDAVLDLLMLYSAGALMQAFTTYTFFQIGDISLLIILTSLIYFQKKV